MIAHRMADRKWKETKQQPSMLAWPAVLGSSLISFHFLWAILCLQAVYLCEIVTYCLGDCHPCQLPISNGITFHD